MAYGPCGEQFRAAFSCFVFSKEEPKGVDCIEHFKVMQGCFREHPDVYGSELEDEEGEGGEGVEVGEGKVGEGLGGQPAPVPAPSHATQDARAVDPVATPEVAADAALRRSEEERTGSGREQRQSQSAAE